MNDETYFDADAWAFRCCHHRFHLVIYLFLLQTNEKRKNRQVRGVWGKETTELCTKGGHTRAFNLPFNEFRDRVGSIS